MNRCPTCAGSKTQTFTVTTNGVEGAPHVMDCFSCNGEGVVSDARLAELRAEAAMWCACEEPGEPVYLEDGQHADLHKHHYRCSDCEGVLQIG